MGEWRWRIPCGHSLESGCDIREYCALVIVHNMSDALLGHCSLWQYMTLELCDFYYLRILLQVHTLLAQSTPKHNWNGCQRVGDILENSSGGEAEYDAISVFDTYERGLDPNTRILVLFLPVRISLFFPFDYKRRIEMKRVFAVFSIVLLFAVCNAELSVDVRRTSFWLPCS